MQSPLAYPANALPAAQGAAYRPLQKLTDGATLGILAVVIAVAGTHLPALRLELLVHLGIAALYACLIPAMNRRPAWRGVASIAVMFTLYLTLATIPFQAIPWNGDAALDRIDIALGLGARPVELVNSWVTPTGLAFFSFVYALFIPYLYLSIFLGFFGRPDHERDSFAAGLALTYAISFLGYLFVPAQGPVVFNAELLGAMPDGGFFHALVTQSVDNAGGPHGAFPSLHVGASAFVCLFDLRHGRLRGWTYLPLVVLIAAATLVTRYHYAVDIVAGLAIATTAAYLTRSKT